MPRAQLVTGNTFTRKCDKCKGESLHEFLSDIELSVITTTWEKDEAKRQKEEFERIKIECTVCGQSYLAKLDKYYHSEGGFSFDEEPKDEKKERKLWGQDFSSPSDLFK